MKLELLNRYRWYGYGKKYTYFTFLPYLQIRIVELSMPYEEPPFAICLAWLFWSLRLSWK